MKIQLFDEVMIQKISEKLKTTKLNARRYRKMYERFGSEKFLRKHEALDSCLNFWEWDKYEQNKLLDLQRVNRCKDRFCPNCRSVAISQALVNFAPSNKEMLQRGYLPFMITLTIPNCSGSELEATISKMGKAFQKFNRWLFQDGGKGAFSGRFFRLAGTVKALEVTVQKDNHDKYHPHYHCIAFLDVAENQMDVFRKYLQGPYSRKYEEYIKYSDADIQIQKLWKFAFDNIRISEYDDWPDFFDYDDIEKKYTYYQCDIRPLEMPKGIYEVFKYTFKDADIHNQSNFETLWNALHRKRLRQGHGELYNLELDCDGEISKDREAIEDFLEKKEAPEKIITRKLTELTQDYHEYRKISRFKGAQYVAEIE